MIDGFEKKNHKNTHHCAPISKTLAPKGIVFTRPPIRFSASKMVTFWNPFEINLAAAANPDAPPPIIMIFLSIFICHRCASVCRTVLFEWRYSTEFEYIRTIMKFSFSNIDVKCDFWKKNQVQICDDSNIKRVFITGLITIFFFWYKWNDFARLNHGNRPRDFPSHTYAWKASSKCESW